MPNKTSRRIYIGIGLLLAASLALAQVYRWVDEDGVVHYSDQPHQGAEEVELEGAPAINMPTPRRPASASRAAAAPDEQQPVAGYETLAVASPAAEETLWNIGGVLNVSLSLQPALQPGHQLRVYFDGTPQEVGGTQFQLQEVYRGAHNLQAEVLDQNGQLMIRSEPVRFYVQQTTIVNPRAG
ncbi:MAG TPA: DUF4124 domain-containing protein [Woeseiaceae bacterium]|nr:DUF4124 domain-containing protein [Woeseiaceae bacterium]